MSAATPVDTTSKTGLPRLRRPAPDLPGPLRRRLRSRDAAIAWSALLVSALAAWVLSLGAIDVSSLGDYGLTPELPATWYIAVALLVLGSCVLVAAPRPRLGLAALFIVSVVVVLYATVPIVSDVPHYHYVYKHIGVTRYIEATGGVNAGVDIYHRWPGFFALCAALGALAGKPDPIAYAAYAEPFFALLATVLVAAAARAVTRSVRVAWLAALLFAVSNWVGQLYYAPQALAFVLTLAVLIIALRHLAPHASRGEPRIARVLSRLVRTPQAPAPSASAGRWPPRAAIVVVLGLDAMIVVTHQLTPYILLVSIAGLGVFGLIRPRWLWVPMAGLTLGYLAVNYGYVKENFGIFTSFDPFSNARHLSLYDLDPVAGKELNARAAQALSVGVWLGGAASALRLTRLGLGRIAAPVVVLAAAPFAVILGQSYGGEAALRVILFSMPWCATLIAWALVSIARPRLRTGATMAVAAALLVAFVPAFYGQEELFQVRTGEVAASEYLYAHAPAGSALVLAGPNFPKRYGPRYSLLAGPHDDDEPNLLRGSQFRGRPLGARDVGAVVAYMRSYSDRGYLVFSASGLEFARVFRLTPPGALEKLEAAIRRSPRFRLWYANRDTRIYELVRARRP